MAERFFCGQAAGTNLLEGAGKLCRLLGSAYGPAGLHLILGGEGAVPAAVRSGSGIMEEFDLGTAGSAMVQDSLKKISETQGDGTLLTAVMTESLMEEAALLTAAGENPVSLRKLMTEEAKKITKAIRERAVKIADPGEAAKLAGVGEEEIRDLIVQAFGAVTKDGIVTVQDTKRQESCTEVLNAMEVDQGYLTEEMVTDPKTGEAVLDSPYILLTDQVITRSEDLIPAMTIAKKAGRPLFLMAQDITGEALATLAVNIRNGKVRTAAIRATAYGERRKEILKDIGAAVGAVVILSDFGMGLREVTPEMLGGAKTVRVTGNHTYFYGGKGSKGQRKSRADRIRAEMETAVYEVDRVNLKNRLARLEGGVAVIYAGAATETEMRAKRQKIKSSIASVQAILRGGAVPGGGIALLETAELLYGGHDGAACRLFHKMLTAPAMKLFANGGEDPFRVLERLRGMPEGSGFDVLQKRCGDMMEMGIADGAETVCRSVEAAVSLAGLMITAGGVIEKGAGR